MIEKPFTDDREEAFERFDFPVQCGNCKTYFDSVDEDGECPFCGSEEIVIHS